ncbi:hypothetical protein BV375_07245 [Nostoc sp. 106C]|nr:hypothetical protein BV375_07245 [Nostoc sp. 106C]
MTRGRGDGEIGRFICSQILEKRYKVRKFPLSHLLKMQAFQKSGGEKVLSKSNVSHLGMGCIALLTGLPIFCYQINSQEMLSR